MSDHECVYTQMLACAHTFVLAYYIAIQLLHVYMLMCVYTIGTHVCNLCTRTWAAISSESASDNLSALHFFTRKLNSINQSIPTIFMVFVDFSFYSKFIYYAPCDVSN